jgi:type II secretory pathway component PulC
MWRILAVLIIGALLAHWTWRLFAPKSDSVQPALQTASGGKTEHLFGVAAVQAVSAVSSAPMPNVKLVGVFSGKSGFAVLELDGKRQLGLSIGHDIVPGAKLVEVASDHIVVEQNGVRQNMPLATGKNTGKAN